MDDYFGHSGSNIEKLAIQVNPDTDNKGNANNNGTFKYVQFYIAKY